MRAYFSGEDLDELHTNVENYSKNGSYYLSLIVNFKEEYVAKIVKLVNIPESSIVIEEEGTENSEIKTFSQQKMFMMDLDIEIENSPEDTDLMKRLGELEEQDKAKQVIKKPTHQTINGRQYSIIKTSEVRDEWELFNNDGRYGEEETWGEPYVINPANIKRNLNQILTLDADNKKETGQILASIYKMSSKEQEDLYEDIETNIHLMTIDMFGYDKLTEALQETQKLLNTFSNVTLWKDILKMINEIFEEALEYSQYDVVEE